MTKPIKVNQSIQPLKTRKALHIAIIIPARYHSTRLPGKPLALIAGISMLQRVWSIAQSVISHVKRSTQTAQTISIQALVATEDQRIVEHCNALGMASILTSAECRSGTERVAEAAKALAQKPDFIINLQGDNALCPPWFLTSMIAAYCASPRPGVITPFVQLGWEALDQLRAEKKLTPFSGTCVVMNEQQDAIWFSKNIIPAIRKENKRRELSKLSPVARHIGLYGYDANTLQQILTLKETLYEDLEGLEQLSFLEAGIPIRMVEVDYQGRQGMTGIDSPEDVARAESILKEDGELIL